MDQLTLLLQHLEKATEISKQYENDSYELELLHLKLLDVYNSYKYLNKYNELENK